MEKYLIWDFDGTLAYRVGGWSAALQEVIRRGAPECSASIDELRAHLQAGFPWQTPHQPFMKSRSAEQWWNALDPIFVRALSAVGIEAPQTHCLAKAVRHAYTNPACWTLFDDTILTLHELSSQGWTHIILSNHVPELSSLLKHLGLEPHIARVFNSAETGYEKPHPQAFQNVLCAIGDTATVWMIGDSPSADILGAEQAGIPAILVRAYSDDVKYSCLGLTHVAAIIE